MNVIYNNILNLIKYKIKFIKINYNIYIYFNKKKFIYLKKN